jgi:hypothetical protein
MAKVRELDDRAQMDHRFRFTVSCVRGFLKQSGVVECMVGIGTWRYCHAIAPYSAEAAVPAASPIARNEPTTRAEACA